MSTGFHGVLFRGQTESVPAHGVQDIEAAHAFVATGDIGRGVSFGVSHMETCARRIREHVQNIIFGFGGEVDSTESVIAFPVILPLLFDRGKIVLFGHLRYPLF